MDPKWNLEKQPLPVTYQGHWAGLPHPCLQGRIAKPHYQGLLILPADAVSRMLVGQPEPAGVHGCFPGMPDSSSDLRSSMSCFSSLLKHPRDG